ncbi:hypothetical protein GW758_01795 [Candidatus Falkowbacteria bacterium]|nr:hypothetical protein [Candidatus Falkowbacteria bacterium]NCT54675.1 hypothetical protein [Candidatus Falkowbacteria bacterium]
MANNNSRLRDKNQGKKTSSAWRYFNFSIFSFIFIGIGFYLFNISHLATQGFILKELTFKTDILKVEKSELEEKISFTQSYYSVNSRVVQLNMVEVAEFEYLKPIASVAKK